MSLHGRGERIASNRGRRAATVESALEVRSHGSKLFKYWVFQLAASNHQGRILPLPPPSWTFTTRTTRSSSRSRQHVRRVAAAEQGPSLNLILASSGSVKCAAEKQISFHLVWKRMSHPFVWVACSQFSVPSSKLQSVLLNTFDLFALRPRRGWSLKPHVNALN